MKKKFQKFFSRPSIKSVFITVLFGLFLIFSPSTNLKIANASPQDELKEIQSQIDQTNKNIETKKSEAASLANEIAIFDDQIRQTELKISETETQMKITSEKITQTEAELKKQKEILNEYLRVIYEESNTSTLELVASSNNFSEFIDRSEYLQTMQLKVKDTVNKVKEMKKEMENKKQELVMLSDKLTNQKSDLSSKRIGKAVTLNLTKEQQGELEKMAGGLVQKRGILYCQIYGGCEGDINGNLKVVNDPSFPYFNQKDWTSPKLDIPNYGCLLTSYAMVRSHFGQYTTPTQEAEYHTFSNDEMTSNGDFGGKSESVLGTNWNAINMALDNGKPVIAGLRMDAGFYTHFVVLIGHSGDTYFVNDPYFAVGRTYNSSRVFKAISY